MLLYFLDSLKELEFGWTVGAAYTLGRMARTVLEDGRDQYTDATKCNELRIVAPKSETFTFGNSKTFKFNFIYCQ